MGGRTYVHRPRQMHGYWWPRLLFLQAGTRHREAGFACQGAAAAGAEGSSRWLLGRTPASLTRLRCWARWALAHGLGGARETVLAHVWYWPMGYWPMMYWIMGYWIMGYWPMG